MLDWTSRDGWILVALFLADSENGAELFEIVGHADAINHAIPTHGELSRSLTKFAKCGLLHIDGDRFRITADWLPPIRRRLCDKKQSRVLWAERGLDWLKSSGLTETSDREVVVRAVAVEEAYEKYVAALKKR